MSTSSAVLSKSIFSMLIANYINWLDNFAFAKEKYICEANREKKRTLRCLSFTLLSNCKHAARRNKSPRGMCAFYIEQRRNALIKGCALKAANERSNVFLNFRVASFFAENSSRISGSFVRMVKSSTQLKSCTVAIGEKKGREEEEGEATTRITLSVLKSPISRLPSYRAERDAPRSFP